MATIRIPTPLRPYTDGNEFVNVEGTTVADALHRLMEQYPDLRQHLFSEEKLRSFINIFLGDEDTRYLKGLQTPIKADSQLLIIPSIAGGNNKVSFNREINEQMCYCSRI
jgi:sulfur-carrier protein